MAKAFPNGGLENTDAGSIRVLRAPARVNLIGEHTDYTGGLVLPMAIPFVTVATIGPSTDGLHHFATDTFTSTRTMAPKDRSEGVGDWSDYPVGVLRELQKLGIEPPPFSLHLRGDVPMGAGLSSSASVEVATAMALLAHAGTVLSIKQIALLCQRAENLYAHAPCGIMDQLVITAATAGHALLLHTHEMTYELLPMDTGALAETRIVIVNSGVKHSISGGEYRTRRQDLERGQAVLRERFGVRDLGDATLEQLYAGQTAMDKLAYKRCHHVISENVRVLTARGAILAGDVTLLGRTMTAAHASYRDDFEASVEEVDFLVETALALPGCYGARLTGGGFGGCTVNLVAAAEAEAFALSLRRAYEQRFGLEAEIYICEAVDGAVARAGTPFTLAQEAIATGSSSHE